MPFFIYPRDNFFSWYFAINCRRGKEEGFKCAESGFIYKTQDHARSDIEAICSDINSESLELYELEISSTFYSWYGDVFKNPERGPIVSSTLIFRTPEHAHIWARTFAEFACKPSMGGRIQLSQFQNCWHREAVFSREQYKLSYNPRAKIYEGS